MTKVRCVRAFISYRHESPDHIARVVEVVQRLRRDGVDVWIDRFEVEPAEGWPTWMIDQIQQAEFVVVVCTCAYLEKFIWLSKEKRPLPMGGVAWEGAIITNYLYVSGLRSIKFIPVVFSTADLTFIPLLLGGVSCYNLATEDGYSALRRRFQGLPPVLPAP